jgi:Cu/Zn superoxide dismutase
MDAVAVFNTRSVQGTVVCTQDKKGVLVKATFTKLAGSHGFHIHRAGDLRGGGLERAIISTRGRLRFMEVHLEQLSLDIQEI